MPRASCHYGIGKSVKIADKFLVQQYYKSGKVVIQVKNSNDLIKLARKKFCSRVKLLIMLLLNFVYFSKKEYYFVMTLVENRDNMITNFNSSVNSNLLTERKLFWSRAFSLISKCFNTYIFILIKEIRNDSHLHLNYVSHK